MGNGYGCIVIDDPWPFDNRSSNGAAEDHYETMPIAELEKLPIYPGDQAHLYMWTTASHRQTAHWLMQQRGFAYKLDIVWVKTSSIETRIYRDPETGLAKVGHFITDNTEIIPDVGERLKIQIGQGNYFRHAHESCLFGVRGGLVHPEGVTVPTVIFASRSEHSKKPEILQDIAELMSPGPRLEMFARRHRPGWICWGNQLPPLQVPPTQQPAFLEGTARLAQMLKEG